MIEIKDKSQCCGCAACVQRCPKLCISLKEDKEGFLYPIVDRENCIDCGLCEKVCPELNVAQERVPINVYAVKHKDEEIRMKSSSGGVFTLLAEQIIDEGGVIFGARFDDSWEVMHDYTETKEGLDVFRGSKYVQSRIGNTFQKAENFLKQGRKVMFTGTPCQIAGLKRYLKKEYENLLAVDFVCHGVPSPKVWRLYLKEISFGEIIKEVNFRDKIVGWNKYRVVVRGNDNLINEPFYENAFMQTFLSNLILRLSCYSCSSKGCRSGSDITLGDFWGIEFENPVFFEEKGVSLVMLHNENVRNMFDDCYLEEMSYISALKGNSCIEQSVNNPLNRSFFFHNINNGRGCIRALNDVLSGNPIMRIHRFLYRKLIK